MPAPGNQHASIANPFEEPIHRVSEYTAKEIATLQSRLQQQLGPEYLSSRAGPSGQKVHYVAAEKVIALANEVFGFNGWSSSITNLQVDFCDDNPQTGRTSLGLSVVVRVTLRDGTYHEDIGYGHMENCKGKAAAFEKAKKEGTTDGLKRALRTFGNVLGNCIYDKAYLNKVTKMKVEPSKFDAKQLYRHPDYAVRETPVDVKLEVAGVAPAGIPTEESLEDFLGEFDEADFNVMEDEDDLDDTTPIEVVDPYSGDKAVGIPTNKPPAQPKHRPLGRSQSSGANLGRPPQTPGQSQGREGSDGDPNQSTNGFGQGQKQQQSQNRSQPGAIGGTSGTQNEAAGQGQANQTALGGPLAGEAVGFFSARAVTVLPEGQAAPLAGHTFNPRLESPSIRKTPGIDHTKSKPLARNGQHVPPTASAGSDNNTSNAGPRPNGAPGSMSRPGPPLARGNTLNPQLDQMRRIGAPGTLSPLANRNQYRPPTMKRSVGGGDVAGRAPLSELSSNAGAAAGNEGGGGNGAGGKGGGVGGGGGGGDGGGDEGRDGVPDPKRQRVA